MVLGGDFASTCKVIAKASGSGQVKIRFWHKMSETFFQCHVFLMAWLPEADLRKRAVSAARALQWRKTSILVDPKQTSVVSES